MNPVIDAIWMCAPPTDLFAQQLAKRLRLTEVYKESGVIIYGVNGSDVDLEFTNAVLIDSGYVKYFENAYFSNVLSGTARQSLVQAYFDIISFRYTRLTKQNFNVSCYNTLFDIARSVKGNFKNCLDFGCGPGTILDSLVASHVPEVVGWDFSECMRQLARDKGLSVLQEFECLASYKQFDLVLSAYVFHYGTVSVEMFQRITQHVEVGGLFVANFHKDLGLIDFLSTLNGVSSMTFVSPIFQGPHGAVVLLSRVY